MAALDWLIVQLRTLLIAAVRGVCLGLWYVEKAVGWLADQIVGSTIWHALSESILTDLGAAMPTVLRDLMFGTGGGLFYLAVFLVGMTLIVPYLAKQSQVVELPRVLGSDRLSFGSPARLQQYLGVEPGAVTIFAIFNDPKHKAELVVDLALWQADAFQFHPLVNTSTLVISRANLDRFIDKMGHVPRILEVPGTEQMNDE